jgi:hypothetical protein
MTLDEFLKQAWKDHANQTDEVATRMNEAHYLIERNDQIPPLCQLITHVLGEHLGSWDKGIDLLQKIKEVSVFDPLTESGKAIDRSIASLDLAAGRKESLVKLSVSDQVRALAVAVSALSEQKNAENSKKLFLEAIEKVKMTADNSDPAHRALAITGNNLACSLEVRKTRTNDETELMILAAQTARQHWGIAGTWLEIERAEYRLSQTYLKANEFTKALEHAKNCLDIVQENKGPSLEFFFGYEVLALAEKANNNSNGFSNAVEQMKMNFERLSTDDQSWCKASLIKLTE